jgi:hypothetical protein
MSKTDNKEVMANADHRQGYRPDVGYTKLTPSGQVYYFDHDGKHIGQGSLHDKVHFQWIPDEASRKHPDQKVDSKRFHEMVQDTAPMHIQVPDHHKTPANVPSPANAPKGLETPKAPKAEKPSAAPAKPESKPGDKKPAPADKPAKVENAPEAGKDKKPGDGKPASKPEGAKEEKKPEEKEASYTARVKELLAHKKAKK